MVTFRRNLRTEEGDFFMRETTPVLTDAAIIWHPSGTKPDDKVVFRRRFHLDAVPKHAKTLIAVDTRYWLYVNEELVVFEGGLFRESVPGSGYADEIDLAPYLREGENVIAVLCWYYGNSGRNSTDSGQAGFLFDCPSIGIATDERFLCARHDGFYTPGEPSPAYLYAGYSIGYRAGGPLEGFALMGFDDSIFVPAQVCSREKWGKLYRRPIPLFRLSAPTEVLDPVRKGESYHVRLPYAMAACVRFTIEAEGGEVVDIRTDRFCVPGGPGDPGSYNGHRLEYVCKPGRNNFEGLFYLYGEELILQCPNTVRVDSVGWRESGYDADIVGRFRCGCPVTDRLVEKAARTLYVCMRDNFMDCPDRERGQWIGDISVQAPQTFFLLDQNTRALVRKAIDDFIHLRKGDVLVGNVPGVHSSELPSQSLCAISEWGLVAQYARYSGDTSVYALCLEPAIRYLALWEVDERGLVQPRDGDWRWFDHLYNVDGAVLENAWYYSALRFASRMAQSTGDHRFDAFLRERMDGIAAAFDKAFWKGAFYASGPFVDDRANAMAVLSGLCPLERYGVLADVLISVSNAGVYMENFVLTALCEMGRTDLAYKRMVSRYYNLAQNDNSTLWEDFYLLGTKNHAWSGAPATIAFRYFMGIKTDDGFRTFCVKPAYDLFGKMECIFPGRGGLVHLWADGASRTLRVENASQSVLLS